MRRRAWVPAIALLAVLPAMAPGAARADGPAASGLPTPLDGSGLLAVDRAAVEAAGTVSARLDLEGLDRPLRPPGVVAPVRFEITARAGLHVGILWWLQAGVIVPVSYLRYASEPTAPPQVGAGDLRLYAKAAIVRRAHVGLSFFAALTAPTGDTAGFRSDGTWTGEPRLALDLSLWRLTLSLSAGARLRRSIAATAPSMPLISIGSELTWGGALSLRAHRVFSIAVEAAGSESLSPFAAAPERTFALLGSVWLTPTPAWNIGIGAGRSIDVAATPMLRADDLRALASVTWRPHFANFQSEGTHSNAPNTSPEFAPDRDHDGIPDAIDKCPDATEDRDGFEDEDGCPDLDNDNDKIPDTADKCPDEPEDYDGFEDEDGCPDLDNDDDGIPDAIDRCPNEPETINGVDDQDGCPDSPLPTIVPDKKGAR